MFKYLVKSTINRLGFDVRRRSNGPTWNVDAFADQKLLLTGRKIGTIVDVGAHIGETASSYRSLFPFATVYCFEPCADSFCELRKTFDGDPQVKLFQTAVAEASGNRQLYLNRFSPTNSLLPIEQNSELFVSAALIQKIGSEEVRVTSLDEFSDEYAISQIDILKMDIQGLELMALQGAERLLKRQAILMIYCEILFAPLYRGQARFDQLCHFLKGFNYHLFDFYNMIRCDGRGIIQADAIFLADAFNANSFSNNAATAESEP